MPRRMSVTPPASHTRAPGANAIIAGPKRRPGAPPPRGRRPARR
jgi:hypothetical protein